MEVSKRNTDLMRMIDEAGSELGDFAMWPDSEIAKTSADNALKGLAKAFKNSGYPYGFVYLSMIQIASVVYSNTVNRDIKVTGLKLAWQKIAELLDK